jgi:hypothetical protein
MLSNEPRLNLRISANEAGPYIHLYDQEVQVWKDYSAPRSAPGKRISLLSPEFAALQRRGERPISDLGSALMANAEHHGLLYAGPGRSLLLRAAHDADCIAW